MDERGWGWTASQIRHARLAEWLAQQPADTFSTVTEFYDALEDQSLNTWNVAHGDLQQFEAQSLINLTATIGGTVEGLQVRPRQSVRDWAEELRARRADRGQRRAQCREAMVHWLYSLDAVRPMPDMPVTQAMLDDARHGVWFAEPFTAEDLDAAAAWLYRSNLVDGIRVAEAEGPVRLHLTDAGVKCAEEFESDTRRYDQSRQHSGARQIVNFHGPATGVQVAAGDYAHQEQRIDASADQLRTMITGLGELVAAVAPAATGLAEEREVALAAARDGAVDVSRLQRFRAWIVATVSSGASAAAAQMITTGADDMVREAMRLTGQL